jgi:hypothetical protein
MKTINHILLTVGLAIGFHFSTYSQTFQKTIVDHFKQDYNYSSIVEVETNGTLTGYIVAGTRFEEHPNNERSSCVIVHLDLNGAVLWEKLLNGAENEACLDVVMGFDSRVVYTGYIERDGKRIMRISELELNTGNQISSKEIDMDNGYSSLGTTIAYDAYKEKYFIGGMSINDYTDESSNSTGIIIKLDSDFDLKWSKEYIGIAKGGLTSVNDLLVTQRGIFVTGTYLDSISPIYPFDTIQGVTAVMLRRGNGSVKWDLSHSSSKLSHVGVQAVYESANKGTLFLLSNNSHDHNYQITEIRKANIPTAFVANEYLMNANQILFGSSDPVGLGIQFNPNNTNELIVLGMYQHGYYPVTSGHSPLFLTRFNKNSGMVQDAKEISIASQNYALFGEAMLSPFNSQNKRMYTPSSLVLNQLGAYTILGHRLHPQGMYSTEVISTNITLTAGNACAFELSPQPASPSLPRRHKNLVFSSIDVNLNNFKPEEQDFHVVMEEWCPSIGEQKVSFFEEVLKDETTVIDEVSAKDLSDISIFPNPSSIGQFNVKTMGFSENKKITVYSISGQIVVSQFSTDDFITLDIRDLQRGTYFVEINDGTNKKVKRIIFN